MVHHHRLPCAAYGCCADDSWRLCLPAGLNEIMRMGVDLLRADELYRLGTREWFMRYIFADVEFAQAATLTGERRREFLAGRFAAKEAALKVLGIGILQGVAP